jgi:hypothetical protein
VEQAINKLLESDAAMECTDILPYVINPLTVSVNHKGKERLILDLRHVNQYIEKRKHNFEGVSEAIQYIIKDGYMFKFDRSSGYHHVSIHKDHQKYLGFSWKLKILRNISCFAHFHSVFRLLDMYFLKCYDLWLNTGAHKVI